MKMKMLKLQNCITGATGHADGGNTEQEQTKRKLTARLHTTSEPMEKWVCECVGVQVQASNQQVKEGSERERPEKY